MGPLNTDSVKMEFGHFFPLAPKPVLSVQREPNARFLFHWLVWMEDHQSSSSVRSEQTGDKALIETAHCSKLYTLTSYDMVQVFLLQLLMFFFSLSFLSFSTTLRVDTNVCSRVQLWRLLQRRPLSGGIHAALWLSCGVQRTQLPVWCVETSCLNPLLLVFILNIFPLTFLKCFFTATLLFFPNRSLI